MLHGKLWKLISGPLLPIFGFLTVLGVVGCLRSIVGDIYPGNAFGPL